jgi:hypothetical protein
VDEAEILGQSSFVVFVPEDIAPGAAAWELEKAAAEGRAENERWHLRKDDSRFWGSGIMTGLRYGLSGTAADLWGSGRVQ